MFEERRHLLLIWFSKWTEYQRKQIFLDLLPLCSESQLEYVENTLRDKVPKHKMDFTRTLPRVLCLYIFSFLDPRSLCRCSQVCWYWKYLTETNELWAPKCLRRGWTLANSRLSNEQGIWKKHYIQNMRFLRVAGPMKATAIELMKQLEDAHKEAQLQTEKARERKREEIRQQKQQLQAVKTEQQARVIQQPVTPWRATTKNPGETHRLNYFDNQSPRRGETNRPGRRRNQSADPAVPRIGEQVDLGCDTFRERVGSYRTLERKRCMTPNPMVSVPKSPWRPTSKRPERQYATDVYEMRRQFREVRSFIRRQCTSAEPIRTRRVFRLVGRDGDAQTPVGYKSPTRIMSAQIHPVGKKSAIRRLSESEIALEELPPPPVYIEYQEITDQSIHKTKSNGYEQTTDPRPAYSPEEKQSNHNTRIWAKKCHTKRLSGSFTPKSQPDKMPVKSLKKSEQLDEKCRVWLSSAPPQEAQQCTLVWQNCESMELLPPHECEDGVMEPYDNGKIHTDRTNELENGLNKTEANDLCGDTSETDLQRQRLSEGVAINRNTSGPQKHPEIQNDTNNTVGELVTRVS
ncbi:F-box only protein 16 [Fasciola gigantica]|uniref:F-box only protein 16 n=1 Tax=Fasciola gigantica TaxID=46835 RepID=A0A504YXQ9_FASGI|nr:F-box only protein 16 [Fasciola gigantica]